MSLCELLARCTLLMRVSEAPGRCVFVVALATAGSTLQLDYAYRGRAVVRVTLENTMRSLESRV